jgi:hypothetical protein
MFLGSVLSSPLSRTQLKRHARNMSCARGHDAGYSLDRESVLLNPQKIPFPMMAYLRRDNLRRATLSTRETYWIA